MCSVGAIQTITLLLCCQGTHPRVVADATRHLSMNSEQKLVVAGNLVFHGPREEVVPYFQSLGFYIPERKAVSDFLQEVTSMKDQKVSLSLPCEPSLMIAECAFLILLSLFLPVLPYSSPSYFLSCCLPVCLSCMHRTSSNASAWSPHHTLV